MSGFLPAGLPSIDVGAWLGPVALLLLGGGFVAMTGWGLVKSYLSGDGHFGIIEGYVGFVRHGKSMLAVQDCIALARGRNAVLASNIGITAKGVETVLLPLTDDGLDLDMLMELALRCRSENRGLVLLIDEAGIVMPARQWASFPVGLMWLLQQSGKLMVEIRYTTQHPAFVDSVLRSLTAVVHNVRSTPPPTIKRRIKGKRPLFMTVTTSIPGDFGSSMPEKVMWKRRVRYRREWEGSYDTDAAILPAGRLKGAAEFAERIAGAGDRSGYLGGLDPRLAATIAQLPQAERQRVVASLSEARGASSRPPAAAVKGTSAGDTGGSTEK